MVCVEVYANLGVQLRGWLLEAPIKVLAVVVAGAVGLPGSPTTCLLPSASEAIRLSSFEPKRAGDMELSKRMRSASRQVNAIRSRRSSSNSRALLVLLTCWSLTGAGVGRGVAALACCSSERFRFSASARLPGGGGGIGNGSGLSFRCN